MCIDNADNDDDGLIDWQQESDCQPCQPSPVVIDIRGDGFNLTNRTNGVLFDIAGTGHPMRLPWVQADDAWLALDRNGNGVIDSGKELFGNYTQQPPSTVRNGFLAVAVYDLPENGGNSDGRIDSADAIFASLRLWRDANMNGISEFSELVALPSLGVAGIELDYKESRKRDAHGNEFRYRSKIYDDEKIHSARWAYDVFLISLS